MRSVFFVLFLPMIISAQSIPPGYYDAAAGKSGAVLKTALFGIIKNPQVDSYDGLWDDFWETDVRPDNTIWDIYSNIHWASASSQCGNYSKEGDCYNREHSFPKSWFNDAKPMYSDLFHIYPTDGFVNNRRSNYPFGEVDAPTYTSGNGSRLGPNVTDGYTGVVFEPVDEYKGDLARTYFYMVTCYEDKVVSWENYDSNGNQVLNGTTFPAFEDWTLELLLAWHLQDPVSQKEIDRNEAVYSIQNNRNPFIDHPEYVASVWDQNQPEDEILLTENFEDALAQNWTFYSKTSNKNWEILNQSSGAGGTAYYTEINGFNGDTASDDWLISPDFSLNSVNSPRLELYLYRRYTGPDLQLLISTNYLSGSDPATATWQTLNYSVPGEQSWTLNSVDLSTFIGESNLHIACHYISNGTTSGTAALWRMDEFSIRAVPLAISAEPGQPYRAGFLLVSAWPNPFNQQVMVKIANPQKTLLVEIFNLSGQRVYSDTPMFKPGQSWQFRWDAVGQPTGVYFLRASGAGQQAVQKLILIK